MSTPTRVNIRTPEVMAQVQAQVLVDVLSLLAIPVVIQLTQYTMFVTFYFVVLLPGKI